MTPHKVLQFSLQTIIILLLVGITNRTHCDIKLPAYTKTPTELARPKISFWLSKKPEREATRTQAWCLPSLKKNPPAVHENVTFVAAPWYDILQQLVRHQTASSPLINASFGSKKFSNGAVILDHDLVRNGFALFKKLGITRIFTCSGHRNYFKKFQDAGIEVISQLFPPLERITPAPHRDILYSFVGASSTHGIRAKVLRLPQRPGVVLKDRGKFFWYHKGARAKKWKNDYRNIMSRSRFALCPSGGSPFTFRLSEAIWSGAVPVLITNNTHILPPGIDWDRYIIQVHGKEIHNLDKIIRAIPIEQEEEMRANCFQLARTLDADPAHFIRVYFAEQLTQQQ